MWYVTVYLGLKMCRFAKYIAVISVIFNVRLDITPRAVAVMGGRVTRIGVADRVPQCRLFVRFGTKVAF